MTGSVVGWDEWWEQCGARFDYDVIAGHQAFENMLVAEALMYEIFGDDG